MFKFFNDGTKNKTGLWVFKTNKYNKFKFIKIQEWTEGYLSVMQGEVNLSSKKIDKNKACIFGNIDGKDKFEIVSAVLGYYENKEFVLTTDWIDETEIDSFLEETMKGTEM